MIIQKSYQNDLQKIWKQLGSGNRDVLLKFAQFLLEQEGQADQRVSPPSEPLNIPAPPNENAIQALKRLKRSYPMIDADMQLLDAASQLITQKVLGVPDVDLIEKMEQLFVESYQQWCKRAS